MSLENLDTGQKNALAFKIKHNRSSDRDADLEALMSAHSSMVKSLMRGKIRPEGIFATAEDLFQEGNLGLLRAVDKFDPPKGSYTTHAYNWVRSAISYACWRHYKNDGNYSAPYEDSRGYENQDRRVFEEVLIRKEIDVFIKRAVNWLNAVNKPKMAYTIERYFDEDQLSMDKIGKEMKEKFGKELGRGGVSIAIKRGFRMILNSNTEEGEWLGDFLDVRF